jgi:predicted lipid-binding transport protein (Tim44 family)
MRRLIVGWMTRSAALRAGSVAAACGWAAAALGRTGGGSHSAATSTSSGGHSGIPSFGGGGDGSFGGIIALIVIGLIVYFIYRRFTRAAPGPQGFAPGPQGFGPGMQSVASAAPGAQAALSALGAVLGAGAAGRIGNGATPWGARPDPILSAAVDKIRELDPGFELETFLQRAEMTFFLVKRGIQQNDAAAIRPYLNDAVFAVVSRDIGQTKAQHRRALLESLNVRALHVESADCGSQGQRMQIHFDLVYRAKMLDDANRVVSDEGDDHRHGERWTFVRDAAARTPVDGGVTASRCPSCGAELRLNLDGTCTHCRASVTNGTVDWVVADVQPAPFVGYSGESSLAVAAPTVGQGIANLQASDPAFALDAFQARAKAAFLALQDAWCRQNLDAGRGFLSPGAYFTWRAQLETLAAEGRRNVMENLEVRSVAPIQIVHGRVYDDLTVRITAAAADFEIDAAGKIVFGDRTVRAFTEDWTFQRSVGVATSQKAGTLENTCPSCGAPVSLNQIGECRYCKAAVTSGKFDWVVSRIEQEDLAGGGADGNLNGSLENVGADIALQVGGAIVGGLLGSLLSGNNSSKDSNDQWS